MVRQFWIPSKTSVFHITSLILGKMIVITTKLTTKLVGHDGSGIICN